MEKGTNSENLKGVGIRGKFPNLMNEEEIGAPHILNEIKRGKKRNIKTEKRKRGNINSKKR